MRVAQMLVFVSLTAGCLLPTAHGQRRGMNMPLETLSAVGTVKDMRPRLLQVAVDGDQEWLISVPDNYENVVFEATATPQWLQQRMPVQFTAMVVVEKRKREIVIKEPVSALTVAPLRPDVGMGVFPEQVNDQRGSLFNRQTDEAKEKRANKEKEPDEVSCLIIGRLVENKEGKLRVAAGNISVRLELAPKAEISVLWHDLQWVLPGDKVEFSARYPAGRKGQAEGQRMTITAAKPLDLEDKAAKRRRKPARERKSADSEVGKDIDKDVDKDVDKDKDK